MGDHGKQGRNKPNVINSLGIVGEDLERSTSSFRKYARMVADEVRYEADGWTIDLVVLLTGPVPEWCGRLSPFTASKLAAAPDYFWPFPQKLAELAAAGKRFLEMSAGRWWR